MAANPPKLLLNNSDVRRWYDNMSRSSVSNAKIRLRRLNLFCDRIGTTPEELVRMGEESPKKAEDCLLDHVTWMEEHEYSPMYVEGVIKSIKSWLAYNRIDIRRRIRISGAGTCTTISDEKVPDQDQLRSILSAATPRGRAIISLMAFSGVRPQVMGLADASDGLRIGDLPELTIGGRNVAFSQSPAMVIVRHSLSKTRNKYVTFLAEEGCGHLLGYLRYRIVQGDVLGPESPLIAVERRNRLKGWHNRGHDSPPFMTTPAITGSIRDTIRSVTEVRPYALRAYFDTQLLMAESHGCMTHAYRQFFMGHKGDMEARYTTNRGRLTDQMREDMRRAYRQSQLFLSSGAAANDEDSKRRMLLDMWGQQAKMYGMDPRSMIRDGPGPAPAVAPGCGAPDNSAGDRKPDIQAPDIPGTASAQDTALGSSSPDNSAGDRKPDIQAPDIPGAAPAQDGGPDSPYDSRIIEGESDLVLYCSRGWDLVRDIPGGRFLMRRAKIPPHAGISREGQAQ